MTSEPRRFRCLGRRVVLRVSHALVLAALSLTACRVELVQDAELEGDMRLPSRLLDVPYIPYDDASEQSLEGVVREELGGMLVAEDVNAQLQRRFEALDWVPAGTGGAWTHQVEVEEVSTTLSSLAYSVEGADPEPLDAVRFTLRRRGAGAWATTAPIVFAGDGLTLASGDAYAGLDLRGAVAVVDDSRRPDEPEIEDLSELELLELKFESAMRAGASGCLVRVPSERYPVAALTMQAKVRTARAREAPPRPALEVEGVVVADALSESTTRLRVEVAAESAWSEHDVVLARTLGTEQSERNVVVMVQPYADIREFVAHEAAVAATLARQLQAFEGEGMKLRRSVTIAAVPPGAPIGVVVASLLQGGPLPAENMSSVLILQDYVGSAAAGGMRVYGSEASDLIERVRSTVRTLGWELEEVGGHAGQGQFLRAGVPAIALERGAAIAVNEGGGLATSLGSDARVLLRLVLRLAREGQLPSVRGDAVDPVGGVASLIEPEAEPEAEDADEAEAGAGAGAMTPDEVEPGEGEGEDPSGAEDSDASDTAQPEDQTPEAPSDGKSPASSSAGKSSAGKSSAGKGTAEKGTAAKDAAGKTGSARPPADETEAKPRRSKPDESGDAPAKPKSSPAEPEAPATPPAATTDNAG